MDYEFSKCKFCKSYDNYDGCRNYYCCDNDLFEPDKERIIEVAKEKEMSVADVIALINL